MKSIAAAGSPVHRRANQSRAERALDESIASSAWAMRWARSRPRRVRSSSSASDRGSPDSRSRLPIVTPVSTAFTPGPYCSSANAANCSVWCSASSACVSWERSPSMMSLILYSVRPIRWSVTLPCGKLYVRMRSERSPEPIKDLRVAACFACRSRRCLSLMRAASTASAFSLFLCCERASWHSTTIPVGRCVIRTAESVLLTCWPPARAGRGGLGFELELGVGALPDDARDDFLVPAGIARRFRYHFHLPALALRVARVHAEQVAGEERRLVAAGPRAYLEEDVALVVRIARQQQLLQLRFERGEPLASGLDLAFRVASHLGVGEQLLRFGDVLLGVAILAEQLDDGLELSVLAREPAELLHVARCALGRQKRADVAEPLAGLVELCRDAGLHRLETGRPS